MLRHLLLSALLLPISLIASRPAFVGDYYARAPQLPAHVRSFVDADSLTADERDALMMLYAYMPMSDAVDRTPQFYLNESVRPALATRATVAWGSEIPDELFYHYILPLRVNNEAVDSHRRPFFAELWPRISLCPSMEEAILEVNHWCHEKASYQPSDGRTHSPLQSVGSAIGRCGEESTLAVAALRAAGIPARQVYTPRWAHTDDNHAWVEAWANGRWYFLGACEPEPVLNLAWFNQPAARGMLMHARTFGHYRGEGEVLAVQNGNTDLNVTANYAPIDTVTVLVTDADGHPVSGAEVTFRIYNYAEFYPIATKITDAKGEATLLAGRGDMMVWARTPGSGLPGMAILKADTHPRRAVVSLTGVPKREHRFTIVPPPDRGAATPPVTDSQRAANDLRLQREDSLRHAYIASWPDTVYTKLLAYQLGLDFMRLQPIIEKSRGHYSAIVDFLSSCAPSDRHTAMLLLEALPEKDLTDIPLEVLSDVMTHLPERVMGLTDTDYAAYQLSPRVANEELTPYRAFFAEALPHTDRVALKLDPQLWVKWLNENVVDTLSWYPDQATMSPGAAFEYRVTSPLSRDILFVAGARAVGIPACLNPITSTPQYLGSEGWVDVDFSHADTEAANTPSGFLQLTYTPEGRGAIAQPRYYTHFTISKITDGAPELLSFPDFCSVDEEFADPQPLSAGRYMLTSGRRLADGSVLTVLDFFDIEPGRTTDVALHVGIDTTQLQVIGTLDAELKYLPDGASEPTSLLSTAGRGFYVIGLMDRDTEPSHHAINDLIAAADELDALGRKIILLYPDDGKPLPTKNPALPDCVVIGTDLNGTIEHSLRDGLYIEQTDDSRPVFVIADSFGKVVYLTRGYTIGLGTRLATLLRQL
ncbi:MAG: Ig-like domain-containing protein [Paramuribaculum sp.]|nr:Ig-like domain-containing protein [Paramuribaculum sp.]